MPVNYLNRIIDKILDDYLKSFGAVLIEGPKWCGKTTTAAIKSKTIIKLQDPRKSKDYLKLAEISPVSLLEGDTPILIDEWQMAPVLWDAIRAEVDDRNLKGQFILTGSSVPMDGKTMHSGTGRIARLLMRPMSLFESLESNGRVSLAKLFSDNIMPQGEICALSLKGIAQAICRGGWPSSIYADNADPSLVAQDYLNSICESDISRVDGIEKNPNRVRSIIQSYSRNISTLATNKTIMDDVEANDMSISEATFYSYLNALSRLFVIEDIPAWNPAIRSKTVIRSSHKKAFVDPSLAAAALGLSTENIFDDMNTFGFLFESLCIRDLRIYASTLNGKVFYYRDRYGLECDAVIRLNNGDFGLVEIKMGESEIESGARHLLKMKKLITEKGMKNPFFLMILTTGQLAYTRKDGVKVVPIGCLGI